MNSLCSLSRLITTCRKEQFLLTKKWMSSISSFKASDLQVQLTDKPKAKPDPNNLVFGKEISDHMLEIHWSEKGGWCKPKICPVHPLDLHPAAKALHYAPQLFEGLKAYRGADNKIRMFRPDLNMTRMKTSAECLVLPDFDGDELISCMKELLKVDREWVPYSDTSTLYIRPTFIGTEPSLGVNSSSEALLFVITGPVGPYYPTGFKPVSLLADPKYVRAWEGGSGGFKIGGNYAPTVRIQKEALHKHGCQQVLWLYGPEHYLTEVGTMNIMMYWVNEQGEKELVTPPLDVGLVLPGVTRNSLLALARQWGDFKVTERMFGMKEVTKALNENRIIELFGCGTACVVSPIDTIIYGGEKLHIPTMDTGAVLSHRFTTELSNIQYGRQPSDWVVDIDS